MWGRPVSVQEASAGIDKDGILLKNPLRYRGYYYDEETGFYYLNARYYDPQVRRFISADNLIASPGISVQGYNLFAYCDNNPVNKVDYTGRDGEFIELGSGWYYRIDTPKKNIRTQRHIHVLNKRLGIEYMQNEDGSPHDKSKGKKGKMPKWLNKKIVEKANWDYNDKRESFFGNTLCTHTEVGIQYSYGDGTTVFQADNPFMKHTNSVAELEGVYHQNDVPFNSMGYSAPLFLIPIVNPFTVPLSSFESGWTLLPIPLAG